MTVQEEKLREQLRQEQRQMKCYPLCLALKKLKPKRLQCCKHPLSWLDDAPNGNPDFESAELCEVEFKEAYTRYSFYLTRHHIYIEYTRAKGNNIKRFEKRCDDIKKIVAFIKENNQRIKEHNKAFRTYDCEAM